MKTRTQGKKFNSGRRRLLKAAGGCAAISYTSMLSQMVSLAMTKSVLAATPQDEYKALVCLYLRGGNDSYNMLIPYEPSEHADYATVRTAVAVPRAQLANSVIADSNGRRFAFHPRMPEMVEMYNNGSLACIANVGSMVEPTDLNQYNNNLTRRPVGLFSHDDQTRAWQTAIPQSRTGLTGWAGRAADLLNDSVNNNPALSINYSLDGQNLILTGDSLQAYVINEFSGAHLLEGYRRNSRLDRIYTQATDSLVTSTYANLLHDTFAQKKLNAINGAIEYNQSTENIQLNTPFPDNSLGREMEQIIRTIAVQETLGQTRQIFYASEGGFDNHGDYFDDHPPQLEKVSQALKAFHDAIIEIGAQGKVALFIATEFARTLTFNGSGTDHGWGGNACVLAPGAVNGGEVYGEYPASLATGNPLDINRGRLLPTTSVDEFYAELAMWFGVDPTSAEMELILPNIRNFWSGPEAPLGFMA